MTKFSALIADMIDRGLAYTVVLFKECARGKFGSRLRRASVEYPEIHSMSESDHCILKKDMKAKIPGKVLRIEDVVADAVLPHKLTPNRSIGGTHALLVFGVDLCVFQGWKAWKCPQQRR